jgi:putative ABC transport system substrate-binding protein
MRRREFIAGFAGAAALPIVARAQRSDALRRVGLLTTQAPGDEEARDREAALRDGLKELGWIEGRNLRLEVRRAAGNEDRLRALAAELVGLVPDVIVASATTSLAALQRATSTIPIVFAQVTDPVGSGFVKSLARPGGNITGFTQHEFSIGVKWLELLKELAPRTERAGIVYDPDNPASNGYLLEIKAALPAFRMQSSEQPVRNAADIERAIAAIASQPNAGFVVLPGPGPSVRRDQVVALAAQHRLPAVYPFRYWVPRGGLAAYGIDNIDLHRRAASYVDRILKGDKPAELPVQNAIKFQLVINLKTAKALGLDPPITLLARTDEVIE